MRRDCRPAWSERRRIWSEISRICDRDERDETSIKSRERSEEKMRLE
jgi:hypothetical protein